MNWRDAALNWLSKHISWRSVFSIFVAMGILLFLLARLGIYEWTHPHRGLLAHVPTRTPVPAPTPVPLGGISLSWSTYFGGSAYERAQGVAVDQNGFVYSILWATPSPATCPRRREPFKRGTKETTLVTIVAMPQGTPVQDADLEEEKMALVVWDRSCPCNGDVAMAALSVAESKKGVPMFPSERPWLRGPATIRIC